MSLIIQNPNYIIVKRTAIINSTPVLPLKEAELGHTYLLNNEEVAVVGFTAEKHLVLLGWHQEPKSELIFAWQDPDKPSHWCNNDRRAYNLHDYQYFWWIPTKNSFVMPVCVSCSNPTCPNQAVNLSAYCCEACGALSPCKV
jgi:hypothetical protein